jgi:hypothetical protein
LGLFAESPREACDLRVRPLRSHARIGLLPSSCDEVVKGSSGVSVKKVSCEDCYFKRNMLCALDCDAPCPTFRPDHPDGLRPPQQMRFMFRQERSRQVAWALPSAQEQAALHA